MSIADGKFTAFVVSIVAGILLQTGNGMATSITTAGTIKEIAVGYASVRVEINGGSQSEGCNSSDTYVLRDVRTNYESMVASMISAFHAQSTISFLLVGCSGDYGDIWSTYVE